MDEKKKVLKSIETIVFSKFILSMLNTLCLVLKCLSLGNYFYTKVLQLRKSFGLAVKSNFRPALFDSDH